MSDAQPLDPCPELSSLEMAMLDFEAARPVTARAVGEQEIRDRFDMSLPRYHQVLNRLIDRPEALRHDPLLVKRLRRLRERRAQARSAARLVR
ncbi:DUF3263 domain-containing protein [Luteococcus sp. OSA5]|uniref:DUF3263 domain-containing protein n=1 Tax=Luteococcus sp. OSA5 TaxID=3401630 RepID=UPI003B428F65